ncbi:MAG: tRNA 2-thiocytidine(32) synthetase TtcA [Deltaproteobacteria bacterium]|nr:tRNA 2-thiocytidine(32) synthetase TtcA [Deltaproteobacteria bacterium]
MSRLEKRLLRQVGRAVKEFDLLERGDRIMVALSGGKDSFALMVLLQHMVRRAPFPIELIGVNLDQGFTRETQEGIAAWCAARGIAHHMVQANHTRILAEKLRPGATPCPLCARLRRGALYDIATELGANKLALGHHRDDMAETLLLNLFYSGQLKAMAVRLPSDQGNGTVIRPMLYCHEADLAAYAEEQGFPQLPGPTCGYGDHRYRARIKALLRDLNEDNPKVTSNIMAAMANIRPSHLLDPQFLELSGPAED